MILFYQPVIPVWPPCGLVVRVLGYRSGGRVRVPALPDFLKKNSSGSGTGSTQTREYNWRATLKRSSGSCLENREYGRRDPSRWPRSTLYPHKLAITSPTSGGRSVGIVRSRTQTMEFSFSNTSSALNVPTCTLERFQSQEDWRNEPIVRGDSGIPNCKRMNWGRKNCALVAVS
jgi:hypothetical protein